MLPDYVSNPLTKKKMQITVVQIDLISIYELIPRTKNIFVTIIERKPSSNAEFKKTGRSTVHFGDL